MNKIVKYPAHKYFISNTHFQVKDFDSTNDLCYTKIQILFIKGELDMPFWFYKMFEELFKGHKAVEIEMSCTENCSCY